ncbi:hypothetical protein [Bradyrhizobium sp. RT10b]|uniref:hypothetical protein n=1 Tax=Bradyrhizobium sp. RT10b TaxID=3156331 RepID=UPI0033985A08
MTRLGLIVWMLGLLLAYPAHSDVLRPGYLEIRQTGSDTYSLLFKIPPRGEELRLGIYLGLPEGTIDEAAPRAAFSNGAYVERRTIRRAGGLAGQAVAIQGLSATSTDVLARVETLGGAVQTERLTHQPGPRLSFRPRLVLAMSRSVICGWASSTFCSDSIICCSSWRSSSWFGIGAASR